MRNFLLVCFCVSSAIAQKWPNLKTTFGISLNPWSKNFHAQPLTQDEAIEDGFQPSDTANNCQKFLGKAYGVPGEPSIVLLFDKDGQLAGSQSVLLKSAVEGSTVPFANIPAYQEGSYFGEEAWLTTAYFVDPETICEGLSISRDGTAGDRLWIQLGETPDNFLKIPLTRDELDSTLAGSVSEGWNSHYCFLGMGMHYMEFNYDPDQRCEYVFPLQILYHDGELIGFVWQHLAQLPGDRWEHPSEKAASKIIKMRPKCVGVLAASPGLSTLHHYFYKYPYLTTCPRSEMASLFSDDVEY